MTLAIVDGVAFTCAVSSVVEHFLDTEGVRGSNPLSRTIFLFLLASLANACYSLVALDVTHAPTPSRNPVVCAHRVCQLAPGSPNAFMVTHARRAWWHLSAL